MKFIPLKSTVASVATAATLFVSGLVPIGQASAGPLFTPPAKIQKPVKPNICLSKPWLCKTGGFKKPVPPAPTPTPTPPANKGMDAGTAAALGILGGMVAGAVIANATRPHDVIVDTASNSTADAHVNWCYDHYKSYRMSDNTFQPYNGPRKQCVSPYY